MLVSKKITVGTTAVEILAGEELEQSYELRLTSSAPQVTYLGDSTVSTANPTLLDFDSNAAAAFRLRGESLWVVASSSVTLSVLAYSTD